MPGIRWILKSLLYKVTASEYMRVAYLHPRSVVLVTMRYQDKENVLPLDWHMPLSLIPKLYGICLESNNFSFELISKSGVFVVNFMGSTFKSEIVAAGRVSGRDTNKFEILGLPITNASAVNAPILVDAFGHLECKVIQAIKVGDHTLFVGKVVHEQSKVKTDSQLYHVTRSTSFSIQEELATTSGPSKKG